VGRTDLHDCIRRADSGAGLDATSELFAELADDIADLGEGRIEELCRKFILKAQIFQATQPSRF
jgi:hypothetical protein